MKKFIGIQIIVVCILAGLLAAYLHARSRVDSTYIVAPISATSTLNTPGITDSDDPDNKFPLINPAVTVNVGKHFIINFKPLEDQFTGIETRYKQKTYLYFVYLNNAAWLGANQDQLFTAASTIKVPLAMSIIKMAEQGKLSLAQTYSLDELDLDENFGNLYKAGANKSFTLQKLIEIMLVNSDNTAMNALIKVANLSGVDDPFGDVYDFMGWGSTDFGKTPTYNLINLKTLSNMFTSLYNGTYDNVSDSNMILSYLGQSTFNDQLAAGVPSNIPVAHKFGVNATDKTYSDCGIVYVSGRNYLMCAGIQGSDQKTANSFISEISRAAYEYVIHN